MISKFLELVLAMTSISHVFLAIWIGEFIRTWSYTKGLFWLLLFIILILLSWIIIKFSEKKLEILSIRVRSVAPTDSEVAIFLNVYILLVFIFSSLNLWVILTTISLLYAFMLTTNNYHFNFILTLFFGYRYYEVEIEEGSGKTSTYILLTKRSINNAKNIKKVVQVSNYMLIEVAK